MMYCLVPGPSQHLMRKVDNTEKLDGPGVGMRTCYACDTTSAVELLHYGHIWDNLIIVLSGVVFYNSS